MVCSSAALNTLRTIPLRKNRLGERGEREESEEGGGGQRQGQGQAEEALQKALFLSRFLNHEEAPETPLKCVSR